MNYGGLYFSLIFSKVTYVFKLRCEKDVLRSPLPYNLQLKAFEEANSCTT